MFTSSRIPSGDLKHQIEPHHSHVDDSNAIANRVMIEAKYEFEEVDFNILQLGSSGDCPSSLVDQVHTSPNAIWLGVITYRRRNGDVAPVTVQDEGPFVNRQSTHRLPSTPDHYVSASFTMPCSLPC